MTDPQPLINEFLGDFAPIFCIYSALLKEKIRFDPTELVVNGRRDRELFAAAEDGFFSYLISRGRSVRFRKIDHALSSLFPFLNAFLGSEKYLLASFSEYLLNISKTLETEAFAVYCHSFYGN